jgi:hypothetical protein
MFGIFGAHTYSHILTHTHTHTHTCIYKLTHVRLIRIERIIVSIRYNGYRVWPRAM